MSSVNLSRAASEAAELASLHNLGFNYGEDRIISNRASMRNPAREPSPPPSIRGDMWVVEGRHAAGCGRKQHVVVHDNHFSIYSSSSTQGQLVEDVPVRTIKRLIWYMHSPNEDKGRVHLAARGRSQSFANRTGGNNAPGARASTNAASSAAPHPYYYVVVELHRDNIILGSAEVGRKKHIVLCTDEQRDFEQWMTFLSAYRRTRDIAVDGVALRSRRSGSKATMAESDTMTTDDSDEEEVEFPRKRLDVTEHTTQLDRALKVAALWKLRAEHLLGEVAKVLSDEDLAKAPSLDPSPQPSRAGSVVQIIGADGKHAASLSNAPEHISLEALEALKDSQWNQMERQVLETLIVKKAEEKARGAIALEARMDMIAILREMSNSAPSTLRSPRRSQPDGPSLDEYRTTLSVWGALYDSMEDDSEEDPIVPCRPGDNPLIDNGRAVRATSDLKELMRACQRLVEEEASASSPSASSSPNPSRAMSPNVPHRMRGKAKPKRLAHEVPAAFSRLSLAVEGLTARNIKHENDLRDTLSKFHSASVVDNLDTMDLDSLIQLARQRVEEFWETELMARDIIAQHANNKQPDH